MANDGNPKIIGKTDQPRNLRNLEARWTVLRERIETARDKTLSHEFAISASDLLAMMDVIEEGLPI